MDKVHMKAAVDRDSMKGKTKTLCGVFLSDSTVLTDNPGSEFEITCGNCRRIINSNRTRSR